MVAVLLITHLVTGISRAGRSEEGIMADVKKFPAPVEEPDLSAWDLTIIGKSVRFDVPIGNRVKMKKYADLIAGWVEEARFACSRTDHPPLDSRDYHRWLRSTMFELRISARRVNQEIRRIHGKTNKNGTIR